MILEVRVLAGGREVVVTSRFSRYLVELDSEEGEVSLSARGLERSYPLADFPEDAELCAIAAFLVVQLEASEIGIH